MRSSFPSPQKETSRKSNCRKTMIQQLGDNIFQYSFHVRNNKTRYYGLIKHTFQALARYAWINVHRPPI